MNTSNVHKLRMLLSLRNVALLLILAAMLMCACWAITTFGPIAFQHLAPGWYQHFSNYRAA